MWQAYLDCKLKTKKKMKNSSAIILSTIVLIALSYFVFWHKTEIEGKQKIDITVQLEKLAEGDSIIVTNLVYPDVFTDLKQQLQTPKRLISGEGKIKFGLLEYNWLAHVISSNNYLKEFAMEQEDHLVHYRISFREEDVDLNSGTYSVEFMTITRY